MEEGQFETVSEEAYQRFRELLSQLNEEPYENGIDQAIFRKFPYLNLESSTFTLHLRLDDPEIGPEREIYLNIMVNMETGEVQSAVYVYRDEINRREFPVYETGHLSMLTGYLMKKIKEV